MSSVYLKYLLINSMYWDISRTWGLTTRPTWNPPYVICWLLDPATTSVKRRTTSVRTCPMAGYSPAGRHMYRCAWTENFSQKYRKFLSEIQECLFVTKQLDHLTPVTDFSTCRAFWGRLNLKVFSWKSEGLKLDIALKGILTDLQILILINPT